jgi:hypothetical protein
MAAETAKNKCDLQFSLTEWAAIYQQAKGTGTITCDNGKSIPVTITSKGGGLTAGKFRIDDGHGEFNAVKNIDTLLGSYGAAEAHGGAVKSGQASVMTKGDVTLALAGHGEGWNAGVAFDKFTIARR